MSCVKGFFIFAINELIISFYPFNSQIKYQIEQTILRYNKVPIRLIMSNAYLRKTWVGYN